MMRTFIFHYKLRKGLGPQWTDKTEEVTLDDLPGGLSDFDIKEIAKSEFKTRRNQKGTQVGQYIITEIVTA